ncbi:MAG: GNAT family N-acetyltransferase [Bacteroidota bacterium]
MKDMLVRLMGLPDVTTLEDELLKKGIIIKKPISPEKQILVKWTQQNFSKYWGSEMDVALSKNVATCYIAQHGDKPIGFACYDTTAKNFFGPMGVLETHNGLGVGKVLLIKALTALRDMGYAYAIIGGVGPAEYYKKVVNAVLIEGSEDSIYNHLLKDE